MVAIKAGQVSSTVNRPPDGTQAFLVYGPDTGLVHETGKKLADKLASATDEPGDILRLDETDLDSDPDRLPVELRTVSMFGGAKIIRLRFGPKINPDVLADFLNGEPIEGRLIVEAGDLKKTAKLRKLFEASKCAAALPCYSDTSRGLESLVDDVLNEAGLQISPDAKGILVSLLGADRGLSRNEIEKLALYAADQERISADDVRAVVGDASEMALDRIVRAAFTGNAGAAVHEYDRAVGAGQAAQSVLLALQRHVMRLYRFRTASDAGRSTDQAMRLLRPPVFGQDRDVFLRQANSWSAHRLAALQTAVGRTIRNGRTDARLESAETERLLLLIGQSARR